MNKKYLFLSLLLISTLILSSCSNDDTMLNNLETELESAENEIESLESNAVNLEENIENLEIDLEEKIQEINDQETGLVTSIELFESDERVELANDFEIIIRITTDPFKIHIIVKY